MKYIILIFLLAIVSCNDAEDDEIYINDFPHRISEPPLLDNKGDTAFIIMTPAEGWRLHAAGTVVNKDSIALNVKMTHTFLLEEDWFSILVIEAKKGSGSLITAETGLEQGREIFVVPGSITNPQYEGGNELLKSGACLVTNIKDILDGLGLFYDDR